MGIFRNLMSKIFPSNHPAVSEPQQQAKAGAPGQLGSAQAAPAMQQVDVEALLNEKAKNNPQKLNWRTSIVDLMKLVGMESSLAERKELAKELGYSGDMNDSASMNIWLHKQVMQRMSQNGGKVPADLLN